MADEYLLHYTGSRLYSTDVFIAEAKKLGVARAIPAHILKTLRWGNPILLARYIGENKRQRIGKAEVFGYFNISGLNIDAPADIKEELTAQLKVVGTAAGGGQINRQCGAYSLGMTYFVLDTIEDIVVKMQLLCAKEAVMGRQFKVKWFMTGKFVEFPKPVVLDAAKFTRSVMHIQIEGLDIYHESEFPNEVSFIYDYNKRVFLPKAEQPKQRPLEESSYVWMGKEKGFKPRKEYPELDEWSA